MNEQFVEREERKGEGREERGVEMESLWKGKKEKQTEKRTWCCKKCCKAVKESKKRRSRKREVDQETRNKKQ